MIVLHLLSVGAWIAQSFWSVGGAPFFFWMAWGTVFPVALLFALRMRRASDHFAWGGLPWLCLIATVPLLSPIGAAHAHARIWARSAENPRAPTDYREASAFAALRWERLATIGGTIILIVGGLQVWTLLWDTPPRRRSPEWWQVWHPWMDPLGIQGEARLSIVVRVGLVVLAGWYSRLLWATGLLMQAQPPRE